MYGIVYQAEFPNGKKYVGSTTQRLKRRILRHLGDAKTNNPRGCPAMTAAIRKHGIPVFSVLCAGFSKEELDEKECFWIERLSTLSPNGYNIKEGGSKGRPSETTKEKMRLAKLGKKKGPMSEEHKKAISVAKLGIGHSAATKERLRKLNLGERNPNFGKPRSAEHKEKTSNALMGHPVSKETRNKIRMSLKGRKRSLEAIKKTAQSNRKVSDEIVREIRFLYEKETISQTKLAREYGLGQTTICKIVNGKY